MSINNFSNRLKERFGEHVRFNEPLAPYLAYRVGGPADALVFPQSEADLVWVADLGRSEKIPITIVGTGTNLLVRDEGIRGITVSLHQAFKEIELLQPENANVATWRKQMIAEKERL